MTSPIKRPAFTYQRSRKQPTPAAEVENEKDFKNSLTATLNPDLALRQKINDLLFSKDANKLPEPVKIEEEFDSAYIESSENAKKVHDMVQVGETRRFIDEIEYLLDGLGHSNGSPKSLKSIQLNLLEIVEKCFKSGGSRSDNLYEEVNVAFGMKLKSHGALAKIFEALEDSKDPKVLDNLLVLLCAFLYDVRRLDFFFKPALAIKLARHCWNLKDLDLKSMDPSVIKRIKCTQVIANLKHQIQFFENNDLEIFKYIGAWILFKWAFSGLTSTKSVDEKSFLDLVSQDCELLNEAVNIFIESENIQIKEKVAGLLDCLLNRKGATLQNHQESFTKLFKKIICELKSADAFENLTFAKLAVSLTGSSFGKLLKISDFIDSFQAIYARLNTRKSSEDFEVLLLSCLINLTDRCGESFIDELRLQKLENGKLLLESIAAAFFNDQRGQIQKSLLALLIGFICRENRTNFQVLTKELNANECEALKAEIFSVASKFLLQQQQQQIGRIATNDDDNLIQDRLNEIVLKFK